jgi:intracellular sulfur oxidation DsrE/DsrF family protein
MSVHKTHDRFLAIAVAHDGIAQGRSSKEWMALEDLVHVLLESETIPATLCFYTEGVRWLTNDSPILSQLEEIRKRGADIVVCRACLAEAGLLGRVALGRLDSQDHIDEILRHAEHTMVV